MKKKEIKERKVEGGKEGGSGSDDEADYQYLVMLSPVKGLRTFSIELVSMGGLACR